MTLGRCAPATENPLSTNIKEMEEIFPKLGFSDDQEMFPKLGFSDDQGIDSPWIMASHSHEDITAICNVIRRPGGLVRSKMPDRGNKISILAAKNLKLATFMFKTMEHCSKTYGIQHVNSTSVLQYQHQNDTRCPKLTRTIEQKLWRT